MEPYKYPIRISKVGDHSRRWFEGSFSNGYYTEAWEKVQLYSQDFLHFTLDPYLIMLSVKEGCIKYHILSLWYDD